MIRSSVLACCLAVLLCVAALAQEFRIDSHIYLGDKTAPISHNVTLYSPKLVCDFLMSSDGQSEPVEIVAFDTRVKNLMLMDLKREVRVELSDVELIKLTDSLRKETLQTENTKFLVAENFEENSSWSDGWVTLTSPTIQYKLRGDQPANVALLPVYFDFLDHVTRLNSSDPTKIPPFPRMRLNQTIKKLGWLPTEVQMTVKKNSLFRKPFHATSKHALIEGLTDKDREMIEDAKKYWLRFERVELTEYRNIRPRNLKRILTANRKSAAEENSEK